LQGRKVSKMSRRQEVRNRKRKVKRLLDRLSDTEQAELVHQVTKIIEKQRRKRKRRRALKMHLSGTDYLTAEQVRSIMRMLREKADAGGRGAATNLMLFDLMVNTGLRSGEVVGLQMGDLPAHHGKQAITVRAEVAKNRRSRIVAIPNGLAKRLDEFCVRVRGKRGVRTPLFINRDGRRLQYAALYGRIKRIGRQAGFAWLHPHVLRHTYATALRAKSRDIAAVQDQLGHIDISTTKIYSRTLSVELIDQVEALNWGEP